MLSFETTKEEMELVRRITKRAVAKYPELDYMSLSMDISATHASGCPLKLEELANAKRSDFFHDVLGIYRHIDRETGELTDCFLPRYSA